MSRILLVGCGALGSGFAVELAKRSFSLQRSMELHTWDADVVSERNVSAQNFGPRHIGLSKVKAIEEQVAEYKNITYVGHEVRITDENVLDEMKPTHSDIVVDAVDNIPTRQLLWQLGMMSMAPVLHVGMAQMGQGNVSWNFGEYDTFPLSPQWASIAESVALSLAKEAKAKAKAENEEPSEGEDDGEGLIVLPPCELTARRSLIQNTIAAAINALFIFKGADVTREMQELTQDEIFMHLVTNWNSTGSSHTCRREEGMISVFDLV